MVGRIVENRVEYHIVTTCLSRKHARKTPLHYTGPSSLRGPNSRDGGPTTSLSARMGASTHPDLLPDSRRRGATPSAAS